METITITRENLAKYMALHTALIVNHFTGKCLSNQQIEMHRETLFKDLAKIHEAEGAYQEYINS